MKRDLPVLLSRVAEALERLVPAPAPSDTLDQAEAFVWDPVRERLRAIEQVNLVPYALLKGLESQGETLLTNTQHHAAGKPANNALLWGARGTGKSSLIKAVHAEVNSLQSNIEPIALIEIHREDLDSLPELLTILRPQQRRSIVFCDDLTFEGMDDSYKALKSVLEGGLEGRPDGVLFYATSNRRHIMARNMIENERASAIHPEESVDEKVSLSDRFGLWLGFHPINQNTFFEIVKAYASYIGLKTEDLTLESRAKEWSIARGAQSGRVAWQFIQHLAAEQDKKIKF